MPTLTAHGVELAYRIDGEADKPWLLLSNSLATDMRLWQPQLPLLTQSFQVLRYDTRGHGGSSGSDGPYDFPMLVGDVLAILDALAIDRVTMMGLSLGGMTALGLALDHPDRVARLICCDARADSPPAYRQLWQDQTAKAEQAGMAALADGMIARWLSADFLDNPAHRGTIDLARQMIGATSLSGFKGCAAALNGLDYLPHLHRIQAPSLFLVGGEDPAAPPDVMADMAARPPQASLTVIDGAAHLSNLNQPDRFNRAVAEWLSATGGSQ